MKFRTHDPKPIIGLDIGNNTIKAVSLRKDVDTVQLLGYGRVNTPDQLFSGGQLLNPNILTEVVSRLVAQPTYGELNASTIQIALPTQLVNSKIVRLPKKNLREQKRQLNEILKSSTSLSLDQLTIFSNKIHEEVDESKNIHELFSLVSMSKHLHNIVIDSLSGPLTSRNHSVRSLVDGLSFSMQVNNSSGPTMIVDFGYTTSHCYIFDSYAQLQKVYDKGSKDIVDAISQSLHISIDEAQLILRKTGIVECSLGDKIRGVIKPVLDYFCFEILSTIAMYNDIYSGTKKPVQSITLSGSIASAPGVTAYLAKKTNLLVVVMNPWKNISTYPLKPMPKHLNPAYAGAIGLAMTSDHREI